MTLLLGLFMIYGAGQATQVTKTYEICSATNFKTKHCELSRKLKTLKPTANKVKSLTPKR